MKFKTLIFYLFEIFASKKESRKKENFDTLTTINAENSN
jgi:hypothetical protein